MDSNFQKEKNGIKPTLLSIWGKEQRIEGKPSMIIDIEKKEGPKKKWKDNRKYLNRSHRNNQKIGYIFRFLILFKEKRQSKAVSTSKRVWVEDLDSIMSHKTKLGLLKRYKESIINCINSNQVKLFACKIIFSYYLYSLIFC